MKLVVTGGRGFIGSHFVEEALLRDFSVIDIDKRVKSTWEIKPKEKSTVNEVSSKEEIQSKLKELKKKHLI